MNKKFLISALILVVIMGISYSLITKGKSVISEKEGKENQQIEETIIPEESYTDGEEDSNEVTIEQTDGDSAEEGQTPKPNWYNLSYKVDHADLDYLLSQKVNLWKSYDDRTLVVSVPRYAEVVLIGYRSDYDYCQVEYKNEVGWTACAWLRNLPDDMVDYWEEF